MLRMDIDKTGGHKREREKSHRTVVYIDLRSSLISEAGAEAGKVDFSLFGKEAENADIPRRLASLSVELKDVALSRQARRVAA